MCVCACANAHLHMPFVVVCMCVHVYRVHVFVLTRACALNMAVALGSQDRALFALLTQGASYKLLTLPHLLISLPSISPPTHTHTLNPTATTTHKYLKEIEPCFLLQSHVWSRKTVGRKGGGLLIAPFPVTRVCLVALSARHTCNSEHLTGKAHNKRTPDKLISPLSKPPSLFTLKTRSLGIWLCVKIISFNMLHH